MGVKVLHIIESFDQGAVENWLLRMLRYARKCNVEADWTFYCTLGRSGSMDEEGRALGARIVYSPVPIKLKLAFMRALRAEIKRGKYDVLHCHHDIMSAVYLLAIIGLPISKRIVHLHNADESILTPSRVKRCFFREPMRFVCLALADNVIGISNHVLDAFLAGRRRRQGRDVVHLYGVDPAPFLNVKTDRIAFRRRLGLADDALILLFAGRVVPEKNPVFVVDVLTDLRRLEPRAVAIFAGAGSQEEAVLDRAHNLGVQEAIRMIGWRKDLPEIMSSSDWFILPRPESPREGFGLAVVEAQLAGMRMILSEGIADDPLLSTAVFKRLPLSAGSKVWAKAVLDLMKCPNPSRETARTALHDSPMDMDRALNGLLSFYS